MWHVLDTIKGEAIPLGIVNAQAKIDAELCGHNEGHPFCEDYGCHSLREIEAALKSEPTFVVAPKGA